MILAKKEKGRYKAFPTVVKVEDKIIVAYRDGETEITKPHGKNGKVKILKSKNLKEWTEFDTPFNDNELDAILSGPFDDEIILVTRSFEYKKRNESYVSRFKIDSLPTERSKVQIENVVLSAFFGHMFEFEGELIASAYGLIDGVPLPLVLSSSDKGKSWKFKSVVASKDFEPKLNEMSIANLNDRFIAVIRSYTDTYDLFCSFSDDLIRWSKPRKLDFVGHAPSLRSLSDGRVCMSFRDLNESLPGFGLAITEDGRKWERIKIGSYTGGLYEGGYTDFVELDDGRLFVVYYTCDEDNEPWIEGKVISLR
ncbi:sialidase family protein [Hippea alviniae]|uniref:sialidase family protein n=1 Tax=Hippea alviniae TaxID=1279027 RepID=UPI0004124DB2|nr:sialidase family protein [Hippea alviniae]